MRILMVLAMAAVVMTAGCKTTGCCGTCKGAQEVKASGNCAACAKTPCVCKKADAVCAKCKAPVAECKCAK